MVGLYRYTLQLDRNLLVCSVCGWSRAITRRLRSQPNAPINMRSCLSSELLKVHSSIIHGAFWVFGVRKPRLASPNNNLSETTETQTLNPTLQDLQDPTP